MKTLKKIMKLLLLCTVIVILYCGIYLAIIVSETSLDMAKIKTNYHGAQIYDRHDRLLTDTAFITYDDLNINTINAFVSIEDKRFFMHNGIDYKRITGAFIANIKSHSTAQGGSTITQQLIKNTHLSSDKTIDRKMQEMRLAILLEKNITKEEILTAYLNKVYFGNGIYGIAAAASQYFDKSVRDLTISESCYLAAFLKAPTKYANNQTLATNRKNLVLKEMYLDGKISESIYNIEKSIEVDIVKMQKGFFIKDIYYNAKKILGCTDDELAYSNLKIHTTYDAELIEINNRILKKYPGFDHISIVLDNKSGEILLLNSNKNVVLCNIKRQIGSTIKPIIPYALAFENNALTAATKILDQPTDFGGYRPKNFNDQYYGNLSVRNAIKFSSNIAAIKALQYVGIDKAFDFANRLQLNLSEKDKTLALALGGLTDGINLLHLAEVYSAFTSGEYQPASIISKITTEDQDVLYSSKPAAMQKILSSSTAFLLTDILIDTVNNGTAKKLSNLPFSVAAKTGTAQNTDAMTIAYTSQHTVLSWCGNLNGSALPDYVTGGSVPCETASQLLSSLYSDSAYPDNFSVPNTIVKAPINKNEYEVNNKILEADDYDILTNNVLYEYFSIDNLPQNTPTIISPPATNIEVNAFGFVDIELICCNLYEYTIYKYEHGERSDIKKIKNFRGTLFLKDVLLSQDVTTYYVDVKYRSSTATFLIGKVKRYYYNDINI